SFPNLTVLMNFKARLSLKDAKAAKAIHLCSQVAAIECTEAAQVDEVDELDGMADIMGLLHLDGPAAETPEADQLQPSLEQLMLPIHRSEDQVVIRETSLSFPLDVVHARMADIMGLLHLDGPAAETPEADQLQPSLEQLMLPIHRPEDQARLSLKDAKAVKAIRLCSQVAAIECTEAAQTAKLTIVGRMWILSRGLRLVVMKCLQSPKYLVTLRGAIGRAIDKGDAACQRLSITDVMIPLIEPLSAENLIGEASTFEVPATAMNTALSTTFIQTSSVPPISVADYRVLGARPSITVPPPPKIMLEKEEL
nr:hypothetical protein [Tanacetum cinerariifolium]